MAAKPMVLNTDRLLLRQWREDDLPRFYALNSDAAVMAYFPALLSRQESDALATKLMDMIENQGWGFWAVEIISTGQFIGFTGMQPSRPALPCHPAIEIGWRLARGFWGRGYATEAAKAALTFGFNELKLAGIIAFTALQNSRSRAVMARIGMVNTSNFFHPDIPPDNPLSEHALYDITRRQWLEQTRLSMPPMLIF